MTSFPAATALFFRAHAARFFLSRRALACAALALLPPLIAMLAAQVARRTDAVEIAAHLGVLLELQVVVPLAALLVGSAVVSEEVEDRTITYLFTRPAPRAALLFGRWLAALAFLSTTLAASVALLLLAASRSQAEGPAIDGAFAVPLFESALIAGAVYSALFAVAGVFFRHPILVGLGYAFAVEGFLANLPGGNQAFAVQHHVRSWLIARGPAAWREIEALALLRFESAPVALAYLASFLAIALALGAWRISRREYVLSA